MMKAIEVSFNPYGLRALLIDHNPTSLFLLSKMLHSSHYQVTACGHPGEALSLIRDDESKFDIVISEVHFSPDININGFELLEIIHRQTDLPVVIVSADDRNDTIIKCVKKGACAYLPKPVRIEVIQLLWQHVARKEMARFKVMKQIDNVESSEPDSSSCGEDKEFCGSSDGGSLDPQRNNKDDEQDKVEGKKHRLVWTDELHQQFVDAVKQLGIHNAVPKKVLELMNVPGLTRENVASHLQKYRLNLRKQPVQTQENFTLPKSGVGPVGTIRPVIEHNLSLRTPPITEIHALNPLDHHGMGLGSNPIVFPNNRFYESDNI